MALHFAGDEFALFRENSRNQRQESPRAPLCSCSGNCRRPGALGRDLPGRYLLNRQDYPSGWQPWAELLPLLLGPRFLQGPSGPAPLPLLTWLASVHLYWLQLGAGGLYRWAVLALVLSTAVLLPPVHRRHPEVLRCVALPLLVWLVLGMVAGFYNLLKEFKEDSKS